MSRLSKESPFCSVASTSQEGLEEEAPASASNRTLKVTLLSSQWKSSNGGLSTINRELAIQLAKHPNVEASVYLPQFSEEDKKIAARHNVQLIKAEELPGYEAVDWLASVPENHAMDCIIGHGVPLGRQIPLIKRHNHHCKWIQIIHTAPEELGMYKTYADAISKGEKKHQAEVKLCELADQVVAVGPKLADAYSRSLRPCQKDQEVLTLTPGIFTEFSEVKQATEEGNNFVVLVFGCADSADFEVKGYDIAAKAIAELKDMPCHLMFVGAPSGKEEEVKKKLLDYGISPAQLTVRCFDESREGLAKLLCEVDLAIMPSRTEGFGLTALEALSAGLPVLVSGNSGLGEAFKKVATGSHWIVASEEPTDWAKAISAVRELDRDIRLQECEMLREKYDAKYSWQKQCYSLVETMQKISFACLELSVECESVKLKGPSSQNGALDSASSARPKEGTKETVTTAVTNDVEETACLGLSVECESVKLQGPSSQNEALDSANSARPKEGTKETVTTAVTNDVKATSVNIPTQDEILRAIAMRRLQFVHLSSEKEFANFFEYMSSARGVVIEDVKMGSLLITVKCRSLQVLEDLWTDYTSGHLNEMVQKCLVTEDILNDLGLSELKLGTTIKENDYKACKQILQQSEDDNAQGGSVAEDESVQTGHDADKVVLNKEATAGSSDHGRPPLSVGYNQLSFAADTQPSTQTHQTSHTQSPSGYGWPPLTLEYNQSCYPASNQTYGEATYQGMHTQTEGSFGYGLPPSSIRCSQLPFVAATPAHEEPRNWKSYTQGHNLAVVVRILKAEYNRRSKLKPLLWENTIQLPLKDVYTRLKIVSRRKRDFQRQNDEVNMYGIFEDKENVIVLVEGSPGIGKTTFCLKIAYDWAKEQIPKGYSFPEFEVVLLLKCRDIDGDVMDAINEQLLPERMEETVKKEFMDFIKDIHYQENVLIILDGLDELPKKSESHLDQLLHKKILPFCYVLVTSRQERGITVRQKVDFDMLLQIEGFTKEDAFEYIRKHFKCAGPEHLPTAERLIAQIKDNAFLHALQSNPLNLLLLCVVFEDCQGELPSFRTELYQIITQCLLRRYCAKHNLEAPGDDQALEKQFEDSLLVLGELAWRCLLEDRSSFREEELANFERKIKDLTARKLGLVFMETSMKRINPQREYHFFHKIFQEYLAATYLAHKLLKDKVNVFSEFNLDFYEHITARYRQVFLFLSGILGDSASVLFRQIGETLKSEEWDWLKCSKEEATFFTESFSESRNAERVAMTLCCFIPFPLTVEINDCELSERTASTNILMVAEACRNFPQLQHPVHLVVDFRGSPEKDDEKTVADFLASCPKLETLSFCALDETLEEAITLFEGLSANSTLSSFTLSTAASISSDFAVVIGNSLAANKTLTTVTFELISECGEAWASALETGLSAESPLTSVVLKIYGSMGVKTIGALKKVLSNGCLTSLTLIICGEMQDSLATAVGETLSAEAIFKSLTLIIYGKLSHSGAISLERGFVENNALKSLEVKVCGELPDNWETIIENILEAKKSKMSFAFHPNITGNISKAQVACLCPVFELQSLTLNLWGELSCIGAETLCNLLIKSSTSCVTLNIHGKVTDAVAKCLVSHFKLCKTLTSLSINIWGELNGDGNSTLQELACNGKYSFALNVCSVASDPSICVDLNETIDIPSSVISVFTKVEDKCLRSLSLNISTQGFSSVGWARDLGDGLAKNTSLTTLSLAFSNYSNMSEDWAFGLGDSLAKNMSLTSLSLTFNNYSDMSGYWAHGLSDGLAKNMSLTSLSLTFNNCSGMIGVWAHGLSVGLAKNTSLTSLSLTINNYSDMSGYWADGLSDGLAKNTSLTSLSLTFNNYSDMSGYGAHGLSDGLAKNTSLTSLSLTINNYSDISADWADGLSDGLAKNTSLTSLSLTINNYNDVWGDWARGLSDGLAKNTALTSLSLTINNYNNMWGDWARGLSDGLAKNTSLTSLSLTINNYNVMWGDWACGLSDGLAKNTSLTSLSLTVNSYNDVSGYGACGLSDGLAKNTSLTSLSLTINSYNDVSGYGACGLSDGLAKNTSLTSLSLTINNYKNVREDLVPVLGDGLAKNTSLTTLSLTVNNYKNVREDLVPVLGYGLAKNTSLTTLSLTISNYSVLSEDWAFGLGYGLAKNTSLTTLSLTISNYSVLSGDWAHGLAENKSLTDVNVTITNYSKVSEDWLDNLCNSLAKSNSITALSLTINDHSDTSEGLGHCLRKHFVECKSLTSLNLTVSLYGESVVY